MMITRCVVAVRRLFGRCSATAACRGHHAEERLHGRPVDGTIQHPFVHPVQGQQPRRRQGGSVVLPGILQESEAFAEFGSEHDVPCGESCLRLRSVFVRVLS